MKWSVLFVKSNTSPCFSLPIPTLRRGIKSSSPCNMDKKLVFFLQEPHFFVICAVHKVDFSLYNWHRDIQDHYCLKYYNFCELEFKVNT